MIAGKAVVESAHNGHGSHAEEKAGCEKALCNGSCAAFVKDPLCTLLYPVAQCLHPSVQIQQFSNQTAHHHG